MTLSLPGLVAPVLTARHVPTDDQSFENAAGPRRPAIRTVPPVSGRPTTTAAAFNVASGGVRVTLAGYGITPDVCGAFDFHGYLGFEPSAVGYITNWLDNQVNQLAGNKRPEAAFATVATAAGVPKQVDLATLTRDPDGDPLSYALSHTTTSLGGSVTVSGSIRPISAIDERICLNFLDVSSPSGNLREGRIWPNGTDRGSSANPSAIPVMP
jgi:hypothetical protein